MPDSQQKLHAPHALLPTGWARDVLIGVDAAGMITSVTPDSPASDAEQARGPVLPAMPNLHSHAFQRAMAGLAEVSGEGEDSFWTWREQMYRTVGALGPEDVEAIATKLYVDMLKGGFGAVAEFHYLHHDKDGSPFADPAQMSRRILAAAQRSGIGLTLLPVFYAHSNFGGAPPAAGQRRFIHGLDAFQALMALLPQACAETGAHLGTAFHSLRAATPAEIHTLLPVLPQGPLHIHVAEQQKEVDDCLAWNGRRPLTTLFEEAPVDARWCLIHATHADAGEVARLAGSGAVAGLCPATEANLGDGLFPAVAYQAQAGRLGIGTDSHVATGVAEELRLLEYGQRLRDQRRNRLNGGPHRSAGRSLTDMALAGGAQALGQPIGALAPGAKASLVVLDGEDAFIAAALGDAILDRWLFGLGDRAIRDIMVAGRWVIRDGHHQEEEAIDAAFRATIARLAAA